MACVWMCMSVCSCADSEQLPPIHHQSTCNPCSSWNVSGFFVCTCICTRYSSSDVCNVASFLLLRTINRMAKNGPHQGMVKSTLWVEVLERSCSYAPSVMVGTEYSPCHKIVQSFLFKKVSVQEGKNTRAREDPVGTAEECSPITTTKSKHKQRIDILSSVGYLQWEHDKEGTCVSSNKVVCMFSTYTVSLLGGGNACLWLIFHDGCCSFLCCFLSLLIVQ